MTDTTDIDVREQTRRACLDAARAAYRDALERGLCQEGAIEAALGAIEMLDVTRITTKDNP